tara:strand:+ start:226 stop:801 length:576 start_codon:yes stop_codon:yes gene_type:complete
MRGLGAEGRDQKDMSGHDAYIARVGAFHHICRPKGRRFEVLRYSRLDYTEANTDFLCDAIRRNLSMDLISHQVRRTYPDGHPAWARALFGHCVPASFALLYFLNTGSLVPYRGVDLAGEGHWWLVDRQSGRRYDITGCQYTDSERDHVYETGRARGYYGRRQAPAARVFRLMRRVQPESVLFETATPFEEM